MTDMNRAGTIGPHRWRVAGWGSAIALLLTPLVAMQFTREVQWDETDFIVMGVMLGTAGLLFELAVRIGSGWAWRAGAALAVLGFFLLVWVNLAVGIIGSEDNPANLAFALVPTVMIGGAIVARFRAAGLARALAATALVQIVIGLVALAFRLGEGSAIWPRDVIGASLIFATLWLVSAGLFARAAATERKG